MRFEQKISSILHQRCGVCRSVSIRLITTTSRTTRIQTCVNCARRGYDESFMKEILPVWIDDNNDVRYEQPEELVGLY